MIPYRNRRWEHKNFYFIQPFPDAGEINGLYEIYTDNNAFIEILRDPSLLDGVACRPGITGYTLNPSLAIMEQWLSNASFRAQAGAIDPLERNKMLKQFLASASSKGLFFPNGYEDSMIAACRQHEPGVKFMAGALFAYIALIRSLQRTKMPLKSRIQRFSSVFSHDVPVFGGMIGLAALTFYSLANRGALDENGTQLVSSIDRFFAPKGDEDIDLSPQYLRNRAFDLLTWYLMPIFVNAEVNRGAPPPIIVTADKFLAEVPFRNMPPMRSQNAAHHIAISLSADGLLGKNKVGFYNTYKAMAPEPRVGLLDKENALRNLNKAVSEILSEQDMAGFEKGLSWAK